MRISTHVAALAVAGALTFTAQAGAANLVQNGSFESGFSNWTVTNPEPSFPAAPIFYNSATSYPTGAFGESVPVNNAPTNSPDAAGSRAAYFVGDFAHNETLSQTIFLAAGTYQIGFSTYLPQNGKNNAGEATFMGQIAGVTLANFAASTAPATTWQTFAGVANIATAGNYLVEFVFNTNQNPSKDVVVDQVYVIAGNPPIGVPEPASMAVLGAGLLGLVLARRRRAG
jgi:hypothetical protein